MLSAVSYAYNRNAALNPAVGAYANRERTILVSETQGGYAFLQDGDEYNPENTYSPAGNGLSVLASTDGATQSEAAGGVRYVTGILGGYGHTSGCTYWPFYAPQAPTRHADGSIYLMADGHVRFLKPEQVSPGDDARDSHSGQDCAARRAAGTAQMADFAATFSTR